MHGFRSGANRTNGKFAGVGGKEQMPAQASPLVKIRSDSGKPYEYPRISVSRSWFGRVSPGAFDRDVRPLD
jgi:hypothetical protein